MKKSIFIAVLGVASSLASYGQGIFFNNYAASTQTTGVTFFDGPLAGQGVGSEFTAQLFYGAAGSTLTSSLQAVGNPVAFATSLGYDSIPSGGPIGGGTGAGWFGNSQANFPAYNTTYSLAIFVTGTYLGVTYTGWSSIVDATSQASNSSGIPDMPSALRVQNFSVASPVPEPTTLALAGLGGLASLVMLRRKNA